MKRRLWKRNKVGAVSAVVSTGRLYSLLFIVFSFVLAFASVSQPQYFATARTMATDMMAPGLSIMNGSVQEATSFLRNISGVSDLRAENIRLYQENLRLREWYQKAMFLESENRSLRDLLNVKAEPQYGFITGRVLADAGNAYFKSLLVSAGQNDQVQKGQAVLSPEGLIGRTIEVGGQASRVLLVTDVNSRVPVLIEGTRHHAIMAGENDNTPTLLHLPADFDAKGEMRLVTSGLGGMFPPGLPVGVLNFSEEEQATVRLFSDMDRLVHVRIIDSAADPNLIQGRLTE